MFAEKTRAATNAVLNKACEELDVYHDAVRAHVAARILSAAGHECTIEKLNEAGRDARKSAPTMWR